MTDTKNIALVTGANKGIGLEICRQLAGLGFTVLLGSREISRGMEAARKLQEEGLEVRAVHVDLNDPDTFGKLQDLIAADYGRLDVLVNNAGYASDWAYNAATVPMQMMRDTFETNFFGTVELTQCLLPLIRKSAAGRIVNQSSIRGSLTLHSTPDSGMGEMNPLAYDSSKTALNAFTIHLANALKATPIKVNSAHPGPAATDANPAGTMSIEDGARTAVRLATLPPDGPTGGFFHMDQTLPW